MQPRDASEQGRSDTDDLKALLALHEIALETMSHALCMYDAEFRVILFNQRFVDVFGLSPDVIRRGMTMEELFFHGAHCMQSPDDEAQKAWGRRLRKLALGVPFDHEYELPNGVFIRGYFRPMPDGGWVAISEDITEHRRMQQELRLQFARMNEALRNMTHGLSMFDADERLIVCNAQYMRMFGLDPDVVTPGMTHRQLLAHANERGNRKGQKAEDIYRERMNAIRSGRTDAVKIATATGALIEAKSRHMPNGGWITVCEDVTERVRIEEALLEQNRRFDAALENMAQGLCMFDADLRMLVCNRPFLEMYAFDPAQMKRGMSLMEMSELSVAAGNHDDSTPAQVFKRFRARLLESEPGFLVYRQPNGRSLAIRTQPMPRGGWVVTFEDVTERDRFANALRDQNLRFDAALKHMAQGLSMFDADERLIVCNEQYLKLFQMDPAVVKPGIKFHDALAHAVEYGALKGLDFEDILKTRLFAIRSKQVCELEFRTADGRAISSTLCPLADGGWVVTFEDITGRKAAEAERIAALAELSEQHRRFDTALSNMAHGLLMVGPDRRVIVRNPRFLELFGLPADAVQSGTPVRDVIALSVAVGNHPGGDADALYENYMAQLDAGMRSISRNLANGRIIHVMHRPMPEGGWVAIYEDVTEQRKAEEKIAYMARHDALTGLPNRVLFHERMAEGLARVAANGSQLALLCLDLDHFKTVNDTLGHPIGDRLLSAVARRLIRALGPHDTIARLGGDEFAILQEGVQPQSAETLARRIVSLVCEPIIIDGHEIVSGVTVGVAIAPDHAADSEQLMKRADLALYRAKADGRACHRLFENEMDTRLQEKRGLELDLRKALAAGEFELLYQPLVRARDGKLNGMEALLRWTHALRGPVPPAEFIPIAEENGLIVPLGEWVLRTACAEAAKWPDGIRVSVNLSPVQFQRRGLVGTVTSALAAAGLPAHRLELEITEAVLLLDDDATIATLHQLRALGVRIAIDDFGTGYSSLSYLRSFPFDKIKIDRSFIADLAPESDSAAIIRAIADLGASLGIETTAEGVETAEQRDLVCRNGCTEMQGFLFSRPRPAADVLDRFFRSGHRAVA